MKKFRCQNLIKTAVIGLMIPVMLVCATPFSQAKQIEEHQISLSNHDRECLIRNVANEAGGESLQGRIAIAQLTYKRMTTGLWGNTICKVVKAKGQFSWTKHKSKWKNIDQDTYQNALEAVDHFLSGHRIKAINNALFFHATSVAPKWKNVKRLGRIGNHIFYG